MPFDESTWKKLIEDAKQGSPFPRVLIGTMLLEAGDFQVALDLLTKAAEQHKEPTAAMIAEWTIGSMHAEGQGVPQSDSEAVVWFRRSAEKGWKESQIRLGIAYTLGKGIPQDEREGVRWYLKAAEQGASEAHMRLAAAYSSGRGVAKDFVEAHKWASLCATSPIDEARTTCGEMRRLLGEKLNNRQIRDAKKWAREWNEAFFARAFK